MPPLLVVAGAPHSMGSLVQKAPPSRSHNREEGDLVRDAQVVCRLLGSMKLLDPKGGAEWNPRG